MREYRRANPEQFAEYERRRHAKDAEKRRERSRRYYERNRDQLREQQREYRAENHARLLKVKRDQAIKDRADGKFAANKSISGRIRNSLKGAKNGASWESLAGYTRAELIAHLERQFLKGMSWRNYGKRWHVDHIRPVSSFEFSSSNDPGFKECWALINLRPLWKGQNLSKHAKRLHLV
jgi:hypothetical protein